MPWDIDTGAGVRWSAALGSESYAGPVVGDGKVFVGTNNENPRDPKIQGDRGVLMAFDAASGAFLWQAVHEKLEAGRAQDWPFVGVCSAPTVVGDRLYYLSNRAELVALDTEGFRDGENDGPVRDENDQGKAAADVIWSLDLRAELGVVPRFMAASSPRVMTGKGSAGDLLFVITGNAVAEDGTVPAPEAPSFLAVERATGRVRWSSNAPSSGQGPGFVDGAWATPAVGKLAGREQVLFPGADGWLYAFSPQGSEAGEAELLWKFDLNQAPGDGDERLKESILASPLIDGDRVYLGVGRDPEHGPAEGRLWALEIREREGTLTPLPLWTRGGDDFGRTLSTVRKHGDLLYAADLTGFLHALDPETGQERWSYDAFASIWASPLLAAGRVYLADEDGDLAVLAAEVKKKLLGEVNLGGAIHTTPAVTGEVLYVATALRLIALELEP